MRVMPAAGEIRQIVSHTLQTFGLKRSDLTGLRETVLLDGGHYRARTYRAGKYFAMWLVEIGLLQFYDPSGNMLRTVNLFEEVAGDRVAA